MKINPKFNINKLNKVFVLIAMIHWVISWFSDKMVFTYSIWNMSAAKDIIKSVMAWGYKVLFLVLLIVFWQGIYYFFVKADKRFLRFSVI